MSLVQFYIFRHGETDWNREKRFQGHTDIPLNENGRAQAKELTALLKLHPLDAIVTSDLLRARETAEIVNQSARLPLFESRELRECRLGDPEGMLRDKILEAYGKDHWDKWLSVSSENQDFGYPNGETKREHLERMRIYLEDFCEFNFQYKNIAVSTHGGSIRRLVHHCENAPTEGIPLPNCALYRISYDPLEHRWHYGEMLSNLGDSSVWGKV